MPEFSCCAFIFQKYVGHVKMGKGGELAAGLGMMLQGADHLQHFVYGHAGSILFLLGAHSWMFYTWLRVP